MSNKIIPKSEMDLLSAWLDRNGYPTAPKPELWGPLAERQAIAFLSDLEVGAIQITMPKKNDESDNILRGDGTWPFTAKIVGDDIVLEGYATAFGGANDPQDNGETASGLNTKKNPGLLGCALPMDGRQFLGLSSLVQRALNGSPVPRLPFKTTMVRIESIAPFAASFEVPVIDLGPGKQATQNPNKPHVVDLTIAAAKKIIPSASATNFMAKVKATIIGAAIGLKA